MSYCSYHIYGYGISLGGKNRSQIDITNDGLKRLLELAPDVKKYVEESFELDSFADNVDDYEGKAGEYGFPALLAEVISEAEGIDIVSGIDYDDHYIIVLPNAAPWQFNKKEAEMNEDTLKAIFEKYVRILDPNAVLDFGNQEIENGG